MKTKKLIFSALFFCLTISLGAQTLTYKRQLKTGVIPNDLFINDDGSMILVGENHDAICCGESGWAIKTDSTGKILWQITNQQIPNFPIIHSVSKAQNGYILAGFIEPFQTSMRGPDTPVLLKINELGNVIWMKKFLQSNFYASFSNAQEMPDGGFIAGFPNKLIKTDSLGNQIWSNNFGGNWQIISLKNQIVVASQNKIQALDFMGNSIWSNDSVSGIFLAETNDKGFISTNATKIFKLDSLGNLEWQKQISCYKIQQSKNGAYILINDDWQSSSFVLSKLNQNGNIVWQEKYEITGATVLNHSKIAKSIKENPNGGFTIACQGNLLNQMTEKPVIIKTNHLGKIPSNSYILPNDTVQVNYNDSIHFNASINRLIDTNSIVNCNLFLFSKSKNIHTINNNKFYPKRISIAPSEYFDIGNSPFFLLVETNDWFEQSIKSAKLDVLTNIFPLQNEDLFEIYPNPSEGTFNIKLKDSGFSKIEIYNISGQKILEKNLNHYYFNLDLRFYPKGIYQIHIIQNNYKFVRKIILQ